jgi:hypothetical protein
MISTRPILCEKAKCIFNYKGLCTYPTKIPQEFHIGKMGVSTRIKKGLKMVFCFCLIIEIMLTLGTFVGLKPTGGVVYTIGVAND